VAPADAHKYIMYIQHMLFLHTCCYSTHAVTPHMLLLHTCMHMAICKSIVQEAAMQACKLWLMTAMTELRSKRQMAKEHI